MKLNHKKLVQLFIAIIGLIFLVLLLIFAEQVGDSVRTGVEICLYTLIPSLFVFMALASFFVNSGLLNHVLSPFGWICGKLFHIPNHYGPLLFMSMIGGYPVGAKLIAEQIQQGKLSPQIGQRMLCYCVNSGPAFVIGSVALPLYQNRKLGFFLFFSNIAAFFVVGILTGIHQKAIQTPIQPKRQQIASTFVHSVLSSIKSMGSICGFVLIFSAVIGLLYDTGVIQSLVSLFGFFMDPNLAKGLLVGCLEVTNGTIACGDIPGITSILAVAGLTAFGGFSVHFQIKSILLPTGISMKPFYCYRLIYVLVSVVGVWALLQLTQTSVSTFAAATGVQGIWFSFSPVSSIFLILLSLLLLLSDRKSDIIK
ncbi:hypothetical protein [Massilioclostridium coli]|uniref:hypothetical protein n=1 Tax=Massilioclostridium coli TaxID=1870991 RepID=UPI00085BF1DA|nr:hypothetical protein [Massilioclostridium coli]